MDLSCFVITGFDNVMAVTDKAGRFQAFRDRYSAAIIIPLSGSICFTSGGVRYVADSTHPVFLPKGLDYTNECLETAFSLVFNFQTGFGSEPMVLSPVPEVFSRERYEAVEKASLSESPVKLQAILAELYALVCPLFSTAPPPGGKLAVQAAEYLSRRYADPDLTVAEAAAALYVSEIWLRKVFREVYGTTPFRYLAAIRMQKANFLLKEKRSVSETALQVGYRDIYQFSRAYRKYFGYPPSETP
ncbi:MAG: helix-turn-helix transcriptional regulator [Oscillospiraceae bacterium]|nr:helix-turn-helix transcriptional regulator [Oscillospiraceae bacterium]